MSATFFERVLASVSPRWALSRAQSRMAFEAFAKVRGDQEERLRRTRRLKQSPDQRNQREAIKMREESRWLEETLDLAKGVLDTLVTNIVASGIFPEPQVKTKSGELAADLNAELIKLFDEWQHFPEVTGRFDYATLQGMVVRAWFRDGEIFGQHLLGSVPGLDHGTKTPYSLELLEADFVPYDLNNEDRGIIQGIELNAWGRMRAVHFYKQHPNDRGMTISLDTKRVPAERVLHLLRTDRFHATRGVTEFNTVITRFGDLKDIDESERVAARIAAAMTMFIKRGNPDMYHKESLAKAKAQDRQFEIAPGMVFDNLNVGEEVGVIKNERPNSNLIAFRNSQLASVASGTGTGRSAIAKDYSGTYSSQRQELVEQYVNYNRLSNHFIFRFCQPVWDNFVAANLAAKLIKVGSDIDKETLYDVQHTPPAMPWIDPYKEAQAYDLLERRKFISRTAVIRAQRRNPDQVNLEIQRDQAERERLGIEQQEVASAGAGDGSGGSKPGENKDDETSTDGADGKQEDQS